MSKPEINNKLLSVFTGHKLDEAYKLMIIKNYNELLYSSGSTSFLM